MTLATDNPSRTEQGSKARKQLTADQFFSTRMLVIPMTRKRKHPNRAGFDVLERIRRGRGNRTAFGI